MPSHLFSLNLRDLGKGIITAVFAGVVGYLYQALNTAGFSVDTLNWSLILQVAISSGLGYVLKNALSDKDGKLFGRI